MKVIQIDHTGGPEVMKVRNLKAPRPSIGQALIRLHACGVNYKDTYVRSGLYPASLPAILGEEGAGEVVEVGGEVEGLKKGDRVAFSGVAGAYAEMIVAPADRLIRIPDTLDYSLGAAILLQGMTAHYLLDGAYQLKAGESCLIHAAAGGVGLLLVQLAKRKGARVLATVSTEEKAKLAREAGADEVILYSKEDFEKSVASLTGGRGVDVVYDSVGRATFAQSLGCLRRRGYLVLFGQSSGKVPSFDPSALAQKGSLFLTRPVLGDYVADRESLEWRAGEILDLVTKGKLAVRIGSTFPLGSAADAHRSLEGRRTTGKVLLIP